MAHLSVITFYGGNRDKFGMPESYFSYLVVAVAGPTPESGTASILSLTAAKRAAVAQAEVDRLVAEAGGAEAALLEAEAHLTNKHADLKKIKTERQSD